MSSFGVPGGIYSIGGSHWVLLAALASRAWGRAWVVKLPTRRLWFPTSLVAFTSLARGLGGICGTGGSRWVLAAALASRAWAARSRWHDSTFIRILALGKVCSA